MVWRVVSDFGGLKILFLSLLSVYLTYPDDTSSLLNMVRHMTFAPPQGKGPLPSGIEQLVELDDVARRLTYTSVLGLPVRNYRSEMRVRGKMVAS
jgi:hypothetical protein